MSTRKYSKNSEESEKAIERYISKRVRELGGLSLKFHSGIASGYPDRILIFPEGIVIWVEIKSKGKTPTALQMCRIIRLRGLHQVVFTCDSKEKADDIIEKRAWYYKNAQQKKGGES